MMLSLSPLLDVATSPTLRGTIRYYYDIYHPWVEVAGILLGLIALVLAFKQLRDSQRLISGSQQLMLDARNTAEESAALVKKVQDINRLSEELSGRVKEIAAESDQLIEETKVIKDEMSTRFVSFFPHNLCEITQLMGKAHSSVDVMADIVAYGHYSAPTEFPNYMAQLNNLAQNQHIKLRILIYDRQLMESTRDEQFGGPTKSDEEKFKKIRNSPPYRVYFAEVFKRQPEPQDYANFIDILDEREQFHDKEVRNRGALVGCCKEPFRFFLWLVDGTEAAFSFQMYGEHFDEICFRTRDLHMINVFKRLFNDEWDEWERAEAQRKKTSDSAPPMSVSARSLMPNMPNDAPEANGPTTAS